MPLSQHFSLDLERLRINEQNSFSDRGMGFQITFLLERVQLIFFFFKQEIISWATTFLILWFFKVWFLTSRKLWSLCRCTCSVVSDYSWPNGLGSAKLLCPWGFPGKNTRVDCHFFLQGIFSTQGSNLCLLHWQVDFFLTTEPPRKP